MANAARAVDLPNQEDLADASTDWLDHAEVTPSADGGAVIAMPQQEVPEPVAFDGNLATLMTSQERQRLAWRIIEIVDRDEQSRKEWKDTYTRGLQLLGLKYEQRTEPWENACGAFHPMLLESVIRFNAQEMSDLFPGAGPVKVKIEGRFTPQKEQQAARVKKDLNRILMQRMKGFRTDTDMLTFNLPLAGCAFRKWRFDKRRKLPGAEYLLPEHVVIPYYATSLETADRFTVILNKTRRWIERKQRQKFFLDVPVGDGIVMRDDLTEAKDDITGQTPPTDARDYTHKLFEHYCELDLSDIDSEAANDNGEELPYIVTVDTVSHQLLSVYRDWKQADPLKERQKTVAHHKYMPGFGPYGTGLIAILGGLTESSTSILRQLVDAGTLKNLPAGYKTKTARIVGDSGPLGPGDWRDVDITSGTLKESFFPLPYGEPSTVLYQLLGNIVDEGRRIGSVADMKITDMTGQNMPVGTTLAIIERSMKVMSAVQSRLYFSFEEEYQIFSEIVRDFMGDDPYDFDVDVLPGEQAPPARKQDYNNAVGIIPVADPNATTMAQRIMVNQAIIQLTGLAPTIYDLKTVHRAMIASLGSEEANVFIPPDAQVLPLDPVTENMNLLTNKPVKAGPMQDHDAHLKVHMDAINDPSIADMLKSNPAAGSIMAAAAAHIQEHIAFQYREQLEKQLGVPLPPPDQPLPDDVEYELSGVVAQAADKLLGKHQADVKAQEILLQMQDPVVQNEQRSLDIQQEKVDNAYEVHLRQFDEKAKDREAAFRTALMREIGEVIRSAMQAEGYQKAALTDQETKVVTVVGDFAAEALRSAAAVDAARAKGTP